MVEKVQLLMAVNYLQVGDIIKLRALGIGMGDLPHQL